MKSKIWQGVIAAAIITLATARAQTTEQPTAADSNSAPAVSSTVADVIKMAEGGTSEDVLLAYVQDSSAPFYLSADQILYLKDIGLSSSLISAMLNRDAALKAQPAEQPQPAGAPAASPVQPVPLAPSPNVVQSPAPVYVSNPPEVVSSFYDDLAPYGSWIQLDGVGWCWQPRVVAVNHSWRPYCDSGHWIYTDAGWFWQSDYSWGWAPFHYGRWFLREGCGWVWTPDRVWGPAWVTWRYEGDHCGWAPLPPHADFDLHQGYCFNGIHVGFEFDFGLRPEHFTFISLHDFDHHDYARRCLPPAQVTRIFNHTTVINNYVVNHNTIVNQGIRVDKVAAATHSEFHPLPIHDVPTWSRGPGGRGVSRSEVAVYRPELRPTARPVNMVAQKIDERHPAVQHLPLASPAFGGWQLSRPTSPTLTAHRYTNPEPKRENPQWVPKQTMPEHLSGVQHSGNDASAHSRYSGFVSKSVQTPVPAIKAASEPGSRLVPEVNRGSRMPGTGIYNPQHSQAPVQSPSRFAGEQNQRLRAPTQNRSTPQNWVAQQPTRPAAPPSAVALSRQPQIQLPPVSKAQPSAQPTWSRRETAPYYPGASAGGNQFTRSTPPTQARPQNTWAGSGANRAPAPLQGNPRVPQYYAQSGAQPNWRSQPSASTHAFDPGSSRSYVQARPQFSGNSQPASAAAQNHSSTQRQGDPGAHSRGDAYKHHGQ